MAPDPDHIDLDHPEDSGIGAPREGDMTIRTMCHSTLIAAEAAGVPQIDWNEATWTAWFLRKHGVERVREIANRMVITCDAIIDQESSLEATASAAGPGTSSRIPQSPVPSTASAGAVTSAGDKPRDPSDPGLLRQYR